MQAYRKPGGLFWPSCLLFSSCCRRCTQSEGRSRADAMKALVQFACALGFPDDVLDPYGERRRCADLVVLWLPGSWWSCLLADSSRDPITFQMGLTDVATRLPRPLVNKQCRSLLEDFNVAHSLLNHHNKPLPRVQQLYGHYPTLSLVHS